MKLFGSIKQALQRQAKTIENESNGSTELLDKMRQDWDDRARENARHYVATSQEEWTDEQFFRSGDDWIQAYILPLLPEICQGRFPSNMPVIEIGCGTGRVTHGLAELFGKVDAVDVSGEMIVRAKQALQDRHNVNLYQNNGMDLSMFGAEEFDFAFSSIVFQHIPSKGVIENYIREAWRVLKPKSFFRFQVQGAEIDEQTADTWVGVGFTQTEMEIIAKRCNFEMRDSDGAGTQYYWLAFFKN